MGLHDPATEVRIIPPSKKEKASTYCIRANSNAQKACPLSKGTSVSPPSAWGRKKGNTGRSSPDRRDSQRLIKGCGNNFPKGKEGSGGFSRTPKGAKRGALSISNPPEKMEFAWDLKGRRDYQKKTRAFLIKMTEEKGPFSKKVAAE